MSTVLSIFLLTWQVGCFDPFHRGKQSDGGSQTEDSGSSPDTADTLSYQKDVYPILESNCYSCHSDTGLASTSTLILTLEPAADYDMVVGFVDSDSASDSPILTKATGTNSHLGGTILTENSPDYQTLATWIEQGAAAD